MFAENGKKRSGLLSLPLKSLPTTNPSSPSLRFTPLAWAKLLFWRDLDGVEVGGFGISSAADPLVIEDIRLVRQSCSPITVAFDDAAVADFFDEQVDRGLPVERFSRIWLHTHPGNSPHPSGVDEATFARVFGTFHWSVMFILAKGGATYARLQYRYGPGGAWEIPVAVDYALSFPASDHGAWRSEFEQAVEIEPDFAFDEELWAELGGEDRSFHSFFEEDSDDGLDRHGPFRSAERLGPDRAAHEGLGDRDRRRLDRPASRPAADGPGGPEAAVDRSG